MKRTRASTDKRSMLRRGLSVFLALCLLLTLVPVGVFAAPAALASNTPFTDVPHDAWHFGYVSFVRANNVMQGTERDTFSPGGTLTRAQAVATLFRMHFRRTGGNDPRENDFVDVPEHEWFAPYVAWADANGIAEGVGNGRFAPGAAVTRQQFAAMLHRFADRLTTLDTSVRQGPRWNSFTDRGQIAHWAVDGLTWANYHGIISGRTAATIAPQGTATRAEAAAMLTRVMLMSPPVPPLCPELEARIKRDFQHAFNVNDVRVGAYLGTYNGSVVLYFGPGFLDIAWEEEVAGRVFFYGTNQRILVWSEGVFYTLSGRDRFGNMLDTLGAYELGLLTAENIGRVHFRFLQWQWNHRVSIQT